MGDNIRPAIYGSRYEAMVANRASAPSEETVTIAGKFCESGDILVENVELPVVDSRDLIAIPASGAYCLAMASNYNAAPRPPYSTGQGRRAPSHPAPGDLPGPHALRSVIDAKASGTASHIHGHNGVLTLLYTAAQADRLAHAYVLVGPSHVGKMTVAVHLAQLVNCQDPTPGPCGACRQCTRVAAGHHSDIQVTSLPTTEEGALGTQIRIEQSARASQAVQPPPLRGPHSGLHHPGRRATH